MYHFYQKNASSNFSTEENEEPQSGGNRYRNTDTSAFPQQVVQDLAEFGLTPPSSIAEVKKKWKDEMKKYHSDKFMNDPEKFKVSKEIMQIYNAAYDRLKQYYQTV
jgi:DnaJ-domain-containing protein 1